MITNKDLYNYKSSQELQSHEHTNIKEIQTSTESVKNRKTHRGFWLHFQKVLNKFSENSTIHGVDKILKSDENIYKR